MKRLLLFTVLLCSVASAQYTAQRLIELNQIGIQAIAQQQRLDSLETAIVTAQAALNAAIKSRDSLTTVIQKFIKLNTKINHSANATTQTLTPADADTLSQMQIQWDGLRFQVVQRQQALNLITTNRNHARGYE